MADDDEVWIRLGDVKRLAAEARGDWAQAIDELGTTCGLTPADEDGALPLSAIVGVAQKLSGHFEAGVFLNADPEGRTDAHSISCPHCGGFIRLRQRPA